MRGEMAVMEGLETNILSGAAWREVLERTLVASFRIVLSLASAYLTFCYGLPADALEFIKENI